MEPSEILRSLGATQAGDTPEYVLDLTEHEQRRILLDARVVAGPYQAMRDLFATAVSSGLVDVGLEEASGSKAALVLRTTSSVGFATLESRNGDVECFLRVSPKVGTQQMLQLASLAGMLPRWKVGQARVGEAVEAGLLEWTLRALEDTVLKLLAFGGIRPTHERIRRPLESRVRGKLLVGPWLSNVARGKPQVLPCEFPTLEIDNDFNRVLLWALHAGATAAQDVVGNTRLSANLRRVAERFRGVGLIKPTARQLRSPVLPPSLRHYEEALKLARMVIESIHLGASPGTIESMSVTLDMNAVYEAAFFNIVKQLRPAATRQKEWGVTFHATGDLTRDRVATRGTKMRPDIWIPPTGILCPLILDTKWKRVMAGYPPEPEIGYYGRRASLDPPDIYQATAYALEALTRYESSASKCVSALVYPSLTTPADYSREVVVGNASIHLALCGWNVTSDPVAEVERILESLEEAAGLPQAA